MMVKRFAMGKQMRFFFIMFSTSDHSRTKHIDVQHHFVRDLLENQKICLKYCLMEDMRADVTTKPLAKDRCQILTKALDLL